MYFNNKMIFLLASLAMSSGLGCVSGPCGPMVGGGCMDGNCGSPGLLARASCNSGCGEIYVDEWINEPPVADNCGFDCGGCGTCNQCRPVRTALRLLWGSPYQGDCSCGDGGTSYHSGYVGESSGCNCGASHVHDSMSTMGPSTPVPVPSTQTESYQVVPSPGSSSPTPAPTVAPTTTKRLNPAKNKPTIRTASARVN